MTTHEAYTLSSSGVAYEILPARGGNGRDVTIQNNNATATIMIGGAGVTTTNYGFKLVPGAAISFELDGDDAIWAVSGTSGIDVHIMTVKLEGSHIV